MSAPACERRILKALVHGFLFVHDGGDGFEGDLEINSFAIGNATLYAARIILGASKTGEMLVAVLRALLRRVADGVVNLRSEGNSRVHTPADLNRLHCL